MLSLGLSRPGDLRFAAMSFRVTYATMSADDADLHDGYDRGIERPAPGLARAIH